jgi:hypothetical protein
VGKPNANLVKEVTTVIEDEFGMVLKAVAFPLQESR